MTVKVRQVRQPDLKRDNSRVQFTRFPPFAEQGPCVATPEAHPVVATYTDTFPGARACIAAADWRAIKAVSIPAGPLYGQATINGGLNFTGVGAPLNCLGGIYQSSPLANNWHVTATKEVMVSGMVGPNPDAHEIWVLACVSQTNPLDTNPDWLADMSWYAAVAGWLQNTPPDPDPGAEFSFQLFRHEAGGSIDSLVLQYTPGPGVWNGPGHTVGIRVLCNNGGPFFGQLRVQLLVDGVVVRQIQNQGIAFMLPAGRAGIMNSVETSVGPMSTIVSNWTADQLAD